jgi:alpha-galactosidase
LLSNAASITNNLNEYGASTMRIWSLILVSLLPITANAEPQSWTIGNSEVQRKVTFSESAGLITEQLSDLKTRTDYISHLRSHDRASQEFSLRCNGEGYSGAGTQFTLVDSGEEVTANGKRLTIRLRAKAIPLEVSVFYDVYDGQPALRKHLLLRNTGASALHFSHLNIESIAPSVGPENETTLNTQYGAIPREIFYTGRSEDAGLLVLRSSVKFPAT